VHELKPSITTIVAIITVVAIVTIVTVAMLFAVDSMRVIALNFMIY